MTRAKLTDSEIITEIGAKYFWLLAYAKPAYVA